MTIYAEQSKEGFIIHRITEEGKKEHIICLEIRGTIVYPNLPLPGYYLIFGKKKDMDEKGKHPLVFLTEEEQKFQDILFARLKEDVKKLFCHTVYADRTKGEKLGGKVKGFYIDLHKTLKDINVRLCPLMDKNPDYGVSLIYKWRENKTLDIPKETILSRELGIITEEDLNENLNKFYAFNALRFLIVGFERDRSPNLIERFNRELEAAQKKESRDRLDSLSRAAWEEHDKIKEQRELEDEYEREGGFW